jgi:hypothetical protein
MYAATNWVLFYDQRQLLLLYFFFWPLCCLIFFDMQVLITPLVSSNSSNSESHILTLLKLSSKCLFDRRVEKVQKDKQRSTKHTHKTKDRITGTPRRCTGRVSSSCKACGSYQDFLDRGLMLTWKLLSQWFLLVKLRSSLRKLYGRHHDMVDRYGIFVKNYFPVIKQAFTR